MKNLYETKTCEESLLSNEYDIEEVEYIESFENEYFKYEEVENNLKIYLNEIGNYPLLTEEEEKLLFIQYKNGDLTAREKLINSNLRIVVFIAQKYLGTSSFDFLDLIQEGNVGLIKSIDRFDISKGYKLSTYATWWIRQSIDRGIAERSKLIRPSVRLYEQNKRISRFINCFYQKRGEKPNIKEISSHLDIKENKVDFCMKNMEEVLSLNTPISIDSKVTLEESLSDYYSIEEDVSSKVILNDVYKIMKEVLTERECYVIKARSGYFEGKVLTLEELGRNLNTTKQNIRRIEKEGLRKISKKLKRKGYEVENRSYVKRKQY